MRNSLFILFTSVNSLLSVCCFGQEKVFDKANIFFFVEQAGTSYSKEYLHEVFNSLDYCGMFNPTQAYYIVLDDSSTVRIPSIKEINDLTFTEECIRTMDVVEEASWTIRNGILIKMVEAKHTK